MIETHLIIVHASIVVACFPKIISCHCKQKGTEAAFFLQTEIYSSFFSHFTSIAAHINCKNCVVTPTDM